MDTLLELSEVCKKMRLSHSLAERAMITEGKTNQEYLINLFKAELESRRAKRISDNLRKAGFPYMESFDDFVPDEVEFPDELSYAECRNLKFVQEKKNVLMYGKTGTGKTMLSICIGLEAINRGIPIQFHRTSSLIVSLETAKSQGSLPKLKEKLNQASILILDEFGYIPYDLTGAQLLFDYLSEIHEKKIIILTTNKDFSQWSNILFDPDMAAALIGRLTQHCHLILFPGEDRRLKNSSIRASFKTMEGKYDRQSKEEH